MRQWHVAFFLRAGLEETIEVLATNFFAQGRVDFQQLVNAYASAVAGQVAIVAAAAPREADLGSLLFTELLGQPGLLADARLQRLLAAVADPAHEALRDDAVQGRGNQVAGRTHVEQPVHGARCTRRMQCREHEVPGHGGTQTDIDGLLVAHFADQHDVRVLAQRGAQHAAEIEADARVHLHLVDAGKPVLNRILDRDDLCFRAVDVVQRRIQGCRLAASGRAGHEHHAARAFDLAGKALQDILRHAELA